MYNPFSINKILNPVGFGMITYNGGGGSGSGSSSGSSKKKKKPASTVQGNNVKDSKGNTIKTTSSRDALQARANAGNGGGSKKKIPKTPTSSTKIPVGSKKIVKKKPKAPTKTTAKEKVKAKDDKAIANYIAKIRNVSKATKKGLDIIGNVGLQIQAVKSVAKPGVTYGKEKIDKALKSRLASLNKTMSNAQAKRSASLATGSRKLVNKAITDPSSLAKSSVVSKVNPNTRGSTITEGTGELVGEGGVVDAVTLDGTNLAEGVDTIDASSMVATTVSDDVKDVVDNTKAAEGVVSEDAKVISAEGTLSSGSMATGVTVDPSKVSEVISGTRSVSTNELAEAAGGDAEAVKTQIAEANIPDNIIAAKTTVSPEEIPDAAQIKESEMAQAVAMTSDGMEEDAVAVAAKMEQFSVDDKTLAEFKEGKIEAQDTVQGQIASLMRSFDDGTPIWATSALRAANATMAARGLGSSSMAGAAIVQAAMESALPIAAADASAFREMKMNNLSRQQQISLTNAAAQQGVKINNFNAEQQTALQNSQNAFSLQSQNLSNAQQVVLANAQIKASLQGQNLNNRQQSNLAEAARYAEVSNLNLNNRQQSILQDNSNTLQVNLANMSSKQQAYLANAQLESALQGKKIDNEQQVAITNASRFAEANNLTFTAAEQAKVHNSNLLKTIGLAELSSEQAATLQNAAATASMDMANLSNAQQSAVQNAKSFLSMDMANLNNQQQTEMFKSQQIIQSLFTDQAAENAAKQFNASSETQTKQFMANLQSQVQQFNATQLNTTAQFNAGSKNAAKQFNAQVKNQREQFNSKNALAIAQANANWRQNVATYNSQAQNQANMQKAQAANAFTQGTLDQVWQRERDLMDYAYKGSEASKDRVLDLVLADKKYDEYAKARDDQEKTDMWSVIIGAASSFK